MWSLPKLLWNSLFVDGTASNQAEAGEDVTITVAVVVAVVVVAVFVVVILIVIMRRRRRRLVKISRSHLSFNI